MELADYERKRQINFDPVPPGQAREAMLLLDGLPHLQVLGLVGDNGLLVKYDLRHYSLERVETALVAEGFHLENTLLAKLKRALIHYCERVQAGHLRQQPQYARTRRIYAQVYENHAHGDRDDTPPEWREYR